MRHVLNTLAWGSAAIALAMALPGCTKGEKGSEGSQGDEATGSIKAALTVGGERHDVTAIHYKVVGESSTCSDAPLAETTSTLEDEQLPGSVLPPGAGTHAGADGLFVLPPGNYRVCATPMSASGPSQECAATQATATVISEATTEIVLVSQCSADPNGGLDVVVALNDPPKITDLDITPSKFIIACQTATITAVAEDPDGDALTFAWSVTSSPAGASPRLQATNGVATFATDTAGAYQVRVETSDVNGGSTSLTFPIHVSALSCSAQDQCHAAGSCDLDTGACSNPSAPDGTACDDGDANTSSDTCSIGVCAGTVSSCACPPGFTSLPGDQCAKSYDIDASLLFNQDISCGNAGGDNRYNDCNDQPYGFQWTDVGGALGAVTDVDVELETGITCIGGSRSVMLNGAPIGSFSMVGTCECNTAHGPASFTSFNPSSYVRGGANSVAIAPLSCEGLSQSTALGGAFARVTVTYSLDQTCGGPSCGDGTCDATESCSSCAADCGPCVPACPETDLGSAVPQTVNGSTVGLTNTLSPTCVGSSAPEATFSFTAPASGTYNMNTLGATYDTALYVNDGTCGGASLACNDDFSGVASSVNVALTAGQTVVIVVDGFGNSSGSFTLNIDRIN